MRVTLRIKSAAPLSAIAEFVSRGKEQLVLIRPLPQRGLVLHTMYHADEVRDFQQVPKGDKVKVSEKEVELGVGSSTDSRPKSSSRRFTKTSTVFACSLCSMKRAKARGKFCRTGADT
jgi:non-homologous end joining protein Ku